jgi:hypothetical protein
MPSKLFFAIFILLAASCKEKTQSIYEGCCGVAPTTDVVLVNTPDYDSHGNVIDSIVETHIFIPNIFVPEDTSPESFDEIFQFYFSSGIYEVKSAVYSIDNGDTLFHKHHFLPDLDDISDGWNGAKPDGTIHYGIFNYRIEIAFLDGQTKTYLGKACAFKCHDDGFPSENIPACFFPSQNNGNGELDESRPGSISCF